MDGMGASRSWTLIRVRFRKVEREVTNARLKALLLSVSKDSLSKCLISSYPSIRPVLSKSSMIRR